MTSTLVGTVWAEKQEPIVALQVSAHVTIGREKDVVPTPPGGSGSRISKVLSSATTLTCTPPVRMGAPAALTKSVVASSNTMLTLPVMMNVAGGGAGGGGKGGGGGGGVGGSGGGGVGGSGGGGLGGSGGGGLGLG